LVVGRARFDAARGMLHSPEGREAALRPKTLALLVLLLREAGRIVSRAEILDAVWPGVFVTDDSITQCVVELRQALGAEGVRLRTVPKRGYLLELPAVEAAPRCAVGMGGVPVVAVLPLRLLQPDAALSLFAEGVVDGVVGVLARLREPVVISANSTRRYTKDAPDLGVIGARLGAQYIAAGSLRRSGAGLRLAVELSEAATGIVLWHRTYDVPEAATTQTEDRIAAVIAHTLVPRVEEAELRRSGAAHPHDLGVYHLLLQARRLIFKLGRESFEAAGMLLRDAAAREPDFAPTHASLANWYSLRVGQGWSPAPADDTLELEASAERALALDAGQARVLALLGHTYTIRSHRHDAALALFDRALDAAPNDSEAWMWSAPTHAYIGEAAAALERAERAMALSPEDPLIFRYQHFRSIAHHASQQWGAAVEWALKSAVANPHYTSNLRTLSGSLIALGRHAEAKRHAQELLRIDPGFRVSKFIERHPYRDPEARARYGRQLIEAGLPP
jgi:TolB-like protein